MSEEESAVEELRYARKRIVRETVAMLLLTGIGLYVARHYQDGWASLGTAVFALAAALNFAVACGFHIARAAPLPVRRSRRAEPIHVVRDLDE